LADEMLLPFFAINSAGIFCCENECTENKMIKVLNNTLLFMV